MDPPAEAVLPPYCMGGQRSRASLSETIATPERGPGAKKPADLMLPPGDMSSSPALTPPEECSAASSGADMVAYSPDRKDLRRKGLW